MTVTGAPAGWSVVPEIVGVESFVASASPPSIDTAGAVTSTVRTWVALLVFFEASEMVATTWWLPSARGVVPTLHSPPTPTVAVSVWPATVTVKGRPAGSSVVPEIGGDVSATERAAPPSIAICGGVRSSLGSVTGVFASVTTPEVSARPLIPAPSPKEIAPAPRNVPTTLAPAPRATAPATCQ